MRWLPLPSLESSVIGLLEVHILQLHYRSAAWEKVGAVYVHNRANTHGWYFYLKFFFTSKRVYENRSDLCRADPGEMFNHDSFYLYWLIRPLLSRVSKNLPSIFSWLLVNTVPFYLCAAGSKQICYPSSFYTIPPWSIQSIHHCSNSTAPLPLFAQNKTQHSGALAKR